jgi:thioredoxin-dependent peroxiredoxin
MPLIDPGAEAPAFSLPDSEGKLQSLRSATGKTVVLYFYPKDDTPGCTAQACGVRDAMPKLGKLNAVVFGISPDSARSHAKFADKYDLNFPLLADVPGEDGVPSVCDAFGVWVEKSMYGKAYMGVARTTYVIGPDGIVQARFDKVKPETHAEELLAALGGSSSRASAGDAPTKSTKSSAASKPRSGSPTPGTSNKKKAARKSTKTPAKKPTKKPAAKAAKKKKVSASRPGR